MKNKNEPLDFTEFFQANHQDTFEIQVTVPIPNKVDYKFRLDMLLTLISDVADAVGPEKIVYACSYPQGIALTALDLHRYIKMLGTKDITSQFIMKLLNELYKQYKEYYKQLKG